MKKEELEKKAILDSENEIKNPVGDKVEIPELKTNIDPRLDKIGWFGIKRESMLYGGLYPKTWEFSYKAALGKEVAYYSTINSEDPISMFEGMDQLIESNVRIIDTKTGMRISPEKINELDRLWFILKIRDLSMPDPENKLVLEDDSCSCKHLNKPEISSATVQAKPMTDFAKKYWNAESGLFEIPTKDYGKIVIKLSTIETSKYYRSWIFGLSEKDRDHSFMSRFYLYIDQKDLELVPDKCIEKAYKTFSIMTNDPQKFAIYLKIEKELVLGLDEILHYRCDGCGKEVHTPIQFPNGIENIFIDSNIDSQFL